MMCKVWRANTTFLPPPPGATDRQADLSAVDSSPLPPGPARRGEFGVAGVAGLGTGIGTTVVLRGTTKYRDSAPFFSKNLFVFLRPCAVPVNLMNLTLLFTLHYDKLLWRCPPEINLCATMSSVFSIYFNTFILFTGCIMLTIYSLSKKLICVFIVYNIFDKMLRPPLG